MPRRIKQYTYLPEQEKELNRWFRGHWSLPFPSESDIEELIVKTGLKQKEIRYWIQLARKRKARGKRNGGRWVKEEDLSQKNEN
jgi:hypothetical protein